MLFDQTFTIVVDALLSGKFICPITEPDAFEFLRNDVHAQRVSNHLNQTGRTLSNLDNELFYASYLTFDPERRRRVRSTIKSIEYEIRPTVEFLTLVLRCFNSDQTLYTGDEVKLSRLVGAIEGDRSLQKGLERLIILTKGRLKDNVVDNTKLALKQLVNIGILKQTDSALDIYICTGKLAYILSFMEHIKVNQPEEFENIDEDDVQQELL